MTADAFRSSLEDLRARVTAAGFTAGDPSKAEEEERAAEEREARLDAFERTVPLRYRGARLSDFPPAPFVARLAEGEDGGLILGPNGIGKTRLAWALARHWMEAEWPCTVEVRSAADILSEVKSTAGDWRETVRERYGSCRHLVLDEIDKVRGSESDQELLFALIDERYQWMRQTVAMGNARSAEEMIGLIGNSIYSRLTGDGGALYKLTGDDKRRRQA